MPTSWTLPSIITQYAEKGAASSHIPWNDVDNFSSLKNLDGRSVQTTASLQHISRSPKLDIRMKTYYIQTTGYNFVNLPEVLTDIEVRLTSNRMGRIMDDTVQLCLANKLIGGNQATTAISPIKLYGLGSNLWKTKKLTLADLSSETFGVVIRLQSHTDWPHKDPAFIDTVEMRIW